MFYPIMEKLSKEGCLVVALELRGYGESVCGTPGTCSYGEAVRHFSMEDLCSDVEAVPLAFGREKIDVLLGHDWGAAIAWTVGARSPEKVGHLQIVNGPHPAEFMRVVSSDMKQMMGSWYMALFMIPYIPELFLANNDYAVLESMFRREPDVIEATKWTISRPGCLTAALNYYRATFFGSSLTQESLWPSAVAEHGLPHEQKSKVPTTVIWGMRDTSVTFATVENVGKWIQDVSFVKFDDANHFCIGHKAEQISDTILKATK